jgi:hypothetical protein
MFAAYVQADTIGKDGVSQLIHDLLIFSWCCTAFWMLWKCCSILVLYTFYYSFLLYCTDKTPSVT